MFVICPVIRLQDLLLSICHICFSIKYFGILHILHIILCRRLYFLHVCISGCWTRRIRGRSSRKLSVWGSSIRKTILSTNTSHVDARTANLDPTLRPTPTPRARSVTANHITRACTWRWHTAGPQGRHWPTDTTLTLQVSYTCLH